MDLIVVDQYLENPEKEEGLGWVVTAAVAATTLAGKIFGGRNQKKTAEADARLATNTAQLNSRYAAELNNLKRVEENIKKAQIELNKLDQENDAIVAATGKLVQSKKIKISDKKTTDNTKKIVIGAVGLIVISGILYAIKQNKAA